MRHAVICNSFLASIQLLIAAGLPRRRTAKLALGVCIAWSLFVWCMGEGLAGILDGGATVYMGAPGAALLHPFVAVFVWPRRHPRSSGAPGLSSGSGSSLASTSPLGSRVPMLAWVALWCGFVYYARQPAMRTAQARSAMMPGTAGGEPAWIRSMDTWLGRVLAGHGEQVSITLGRTVRGGLRASDGQARGGARHVARSGRVGVAGFRERL